MKIIISILVLIIILFFLARRYKKLITSKKINVLSRFKKRLRNKDHLRQRLSEEFLNSLMADPESNIKIGVWYTEEELREKADIHRARLSKFGKSKINGEMLFVGPKGGIYKISEDGKKKYV